MQKVKLDSYGRRSSFWRTNVDAQDALKVRALTGVSSGCLSPEGTLQRISNWMLGDASNAEYRYAWKFNPLQVVTLGPDLNRRFLLEFGATPARKIVALRPLEEENETTNLVLLSSGEINRYRLLLTKMEIILESSALWDVNETYAHDYTQFVLTIPSHVPRPQSIVSPKYGLLTAGVDFEVGENFITFNRHPSDLFEDEVIPIAVGTLRDKPYLAYALQSNRLHTSGYFVLNYLRNSQSVHAFKLAAAEHAGLVVVPFDGQVLTSERACGLVTYRTSEGYLEVPYDHAPYPDGYKFTKGEIIGGGFEVFSAATHGDLWTDNVNWGYGLALDGICPVGAGLVAENKLKECVAYAHSAEHDKLHVQLPLSGHVELAEGYHSMVKNNEEMTGQFLNDVLHLPGIGHRRLVNPLRLMLDQILHNVGIVLDIDATKIRPEITQALQDFAAKYRPVGSVVLTRSTTPSVFVGTWLAISGSSALSPWDNAVFISSTE